MHGENKEQEIREIEAEIKKDLLEVEKLEGKLETLTGDNHEHRHKHHHHEKVEVTVDHKKHHVEPGSYVVAKFKELVNVPASKVLEEVIHGELIPLDDNALLEIKGCEVFISHVKTGGSSR
jgi:hypothetical protein